MNQDSLNAHVQKTRDRVVDRFCKLIALLAISLTFVYVYIDLKMLAGVSFIVALLFIVLAYLNKKNNGTSFRAGVVALSSACVIVFSLILGFDAGIYLYLFVAPFLTFLLFKYNEVRKVLTVLLLYAATFAIVYSMKQIGFSPFYKLDDGTMSWIYSYNLVSTFVLSFSIVTYFASTNFHFIEGVKANQTALLEQIEKREESERLVKQSLKDRDELLAEIHHRVKNNLALITAIINLQMKNAEKEEGNYSDENLLKVRNRIYAISLVHNLIYQSKSIDVVNFGNFVEAFFQHVKQDYPILSTLQLQKEIAPNCSLDLQTAIPLALVFNEVISNCVQNILRGHVDKTVRVELNEAEGNQVRFAVSAKCENDGKNEACNIDSTSLLILEALAEQLEGEFCFVDEEYRQFLLLFPDLRRNQG